MTVSKRAQGGVVIMRAIMTGYKNPYHPKVINAVGQSDALDWSLLTELWKWNKCQHS